MTAQTSKKCPVKSSVSKEFLDKIDREVAKKGFNGRGDFAQFCMRYYFADQDHYDCINSEIILLNSKKQQKK